jgi:hypothetical protein
MQLTALVQDEPPIDIQVADLPDGGVALITAGMSAQPMTTAPGAEDYQRAELYALLPPEMKEGDGLTPAAQQFAVRLRQFAERPHQDETCLGTNAIYDFGEPLAEGTAMTCLLAVVEADAISEVRLDDGTPILFYSVAPLHAAERDLKRATDTLTLLKTLGEHGVSKIVQLARASVA